jgi:hypothetical protein
MPIESDTDVKGGPLVGRRFSFCLITSASLVAAGLATALTPVAAGAATGPTTGSAAGNPFCKNLGVKYQASAGAQAFCFGVQRNGVAARKLTAPAASTNVNAANLAEDVSSSGTRAYGQSETSIAAAGSYVVEAWNDATSFFSACPSPSSKEEGTGLAFSANGGKSFTDLGGLPNSNCAANLYFGDPSVTAYTVGGSSYFYISSLFDSPTGLGPSFIAMDACKVTGSRTSATLSCGQPIILGSSSGCTTITGLGQVCNFLDKDFMAIDPARGRLYASFTEFDATTNASQIELSACDLGNAAGGAGPAGGTPAAPVCTDNGVQKPPHFVLQRPDPNGCEYEGAYPAVDVATGDAYVAYEYNAGSNLTTAAPCANAPVSNVMTRTPASCLTLTATSACTGPAARVAVPVVSLDGASIPGYNRFPANDFPRLAVSRPAGTVSMVWNDTRLHPLGDILLQSFTLGSLGLVQSTPVVLNPAADASNFLPALRVANAKGNLDVSWYSRTNANSAITAVTAVTGVSPRTTATPGSSTTVTTATSDWNSVSSDIVPNFGDYTDNVLVTSAAAPYVGSTLYVAWSDGRLGVPQPFEAHLAG